MFVVFWWCKSTVFFAITLCLFGIYALYSLCFICFFFFFKQKTAYEMRISDWSSDVCSSDLLSVDGVNAVTGEDADPSQAGYVLAPWQSTEIDGWRKSLDEVARFRFTDLPDSYAARTGRDRKSTRLNSSHSCASRMPSSA